MFKRPEEFRSSYPEYVSLVSYKNAIVESLVGLFKDVGVVVNNLSDVFSHWKDILTFA